MEGGGELISIVKRKNKKNRMSWQCICQLILYLPYPGGEMEAMVEATAGGGGNKPVGGGR